MTVWATAVRSATTVGAAAALVAAPAQAGWLTAAAAGVGSYGFTLSGAAFIGAKTPLIPVPGGASVDDTTKKLSTGLSGAQHLPFPLKFYGNSYSSVFVSSNGNIAFRGPKSTAFKNQCLPESSLPNPALMVFWDDLAFESGQSPPQGVFVQSGNNTFRVSWRGHLVDSTTSALVSVIFHKGSSNFETYYGSATGGSFTVGTQFSSNKFTQFRCNHGEIQPGTKISWKHKPA